MGGWISIESYTSRTMAESMQEYLRSQGIESRVAGDDGGSFSPGLAFTLGVRLKVRIEDETLARKLLDETLT